MCNLFETLSTSTKIIGM